MLLMLVVWPSPKGFVATEIYKLGFLGELSTNDRISTVRYLLAIENYGTDCGNDKIVLPVP